MESNLNAPRDAVTIDSYLPGGFRIAGEVHRGPLLVFPDRVVPWTVTDAAGITPESLAPVTVAEPPVEVLLVGCGGQIALLPPAVRTALRAAGVGVDAMTTDAACRTYNMLLTEERRVAVALIPL